MIYEVVERIRMHLADSILGVNAFAPLVPMAAGDPALEDVAVESEFSIDYLPGHELPARAYQGGPLVLVRRGDDTGEFAPPGEPEVMAQDSRVGVAILVLYPRMAAHTPQLEARRLSALLRAVALSLGHLFDSVPYEERALRQVQLVQVLAGPRLVPTIAALSQVDLMGGALLLDLSVTDQWAENIVPPVP